MVLKFAPQATIKMAVTALSGTLYLTCAPVALAQSTPTELADLALEDLLNFEISEESSETEEAPKKWSFSYTYRKLSSGEYRMGTNDVSFDDVLFTPGEARTNYNYPVVPTFICQNVHAFAAGYNVTDAISLNIVIPYITQGTDHISIVPGFDEFLLKSDGIGDIGLSASYQKRPTLTSALQFTAGVRLPTGSIDIRGDTPRNGSGTLERLPYTMQIGSGTLDFTGAVHYSKLMKDFKLGVSANTTIRTGKNENDYRLGNNYGLAGWAQYSKNHWFQPGVRVGVREIEMIKGGDVSLQVPAAFPFPASITNPANYGGTKVNLSAILRVCPKEDCDFSISGEYGKPIYQNLNGIQPKDRHFFSVSTALKF